MTALKRWFARSLVIKVGAGLVVMALLMLAAIGGVFVLIQQQSADSVVVNVAGRQRMLSQRMGRLTLRAAQGDLDAAEGLADAADLFDQSLHGLRDGDAAMGLPPAPPEITPQLNKIEELWQPYRRDVQTVIGGVNEANTIQSLARGLDEGTNELLQVSDELVEQLDESGASQTAVDLAGRQRMLSVSMAERALEISIGVTEESSTLLSDARTFNQTLEVLRDGDPTQGLSPATGEVSNQIEAVEEVWMPFYADLQDLATAAEKYGAALAAAQSVTDGSDALLQNSDQAVSLFEAKAQEKVGTLQRFLIGVAVVFLAVFAIVLWYTRRGISPVGEMTLAAQKLAQGDLDVELAVQSEDEVGRMARAFDNMIEYIRDIASDAAHIAQGDLSADVTPQSDKDVLGNAFVQMIAYLKDMAGAAGHIAQGDLSTEVTLQSDQDVLGNAFTRMIVYLQGMADAADHIAQGDLSADVTPQSDQDALGNAFTRMTAYLQEMADAADHIAQEDLTVDVVPQSDRDALGNAFAQMIDNLRALIGQVQQSAAQVASASQQINAASEQAAQATQQVASTIQQVAHGAAQQTEDITQTTSRVDQVTQAIDGIARGAQEQAGAVERASANVTQMSTAIQQVSNNAQASADASQQTAHTAQSGADTVRETIHTMQSIREAVSEAGQKVQQMQKHSAQIGVIIQTIDDIAAKTDMLALNAAVEAARAGEYGRGFAVVADEVRDLAERTALATEEIAQLIRTVQEGTQEAVQAMEASLERVEAGSGQADQAGQALGSILEAVQQVNAQVQQIADATQGMMASSNELVDAMDSVSAVVEENTAATEEMAASSGEISQAMENVASVSQENNAAAEEVSASTEELSAQAEEVTASAQSLTTLAEQLEAIVTRFRLNGAARTPAQPVPERQPAPTDGSEATSGDGMPASTVELPPVKPTPQTSRQRTRIAWDESMRTGESKVDEQHQKLIRQLNALTTAMEQGKGAQEIDRILSFLEEYVDIHFSYEEDCMARHRCPVAEKNKQAHAKFVDAFNDVRDRYWREGPSATLAIEVQRDLAEWFVNHIRGIDTNLGPCIKKAQGVAEK